MNKEFIQYEQALELKELGFNEDVFAVYEIIDEYTQKFLFEYKNRDNIFSYQIAAPLYQQAFRWFREKYNIDCYIETKSLTIGGSTYDYTIIVDEGEEWDDGKRWRTYEEAELACLIKLIEIVKQPKKN